MASSFGSRAWTRRLLPAVLLLGTLASSGIAAPMPHAGGTASRIRVLLPFLFGNRQPIPQELEARLDTDRSIVEFDVDEPVVGLYLEVRGKVEFERVDVECSDGERLSVDAFGQQRSTGLYELVRFKEVRAVRSVRLIGRGQHHPARVGLRLGV
jgi:hypothetical protein